jgi:hypothetical protein
MQKNLRGELSSGQDVSANMARILTNFKFITKKDQAELESAILAACIIQNVNEGNISELEALKISVSNYCFNYTVNST